LEPTVQLAINDQTGSSAASKRFLLISCAAFALAVAGSCAELQFTHVAVFGFLALATASRALDAKCLLVIYLLLGPVISNRFASKLGPLPDMTLDRMLLPLALVAAIGDRGMRGRKWITNKLDRRILFLVCVAGTSIVFAIMKKTPLRILTDSLILPLVCYMVGKRYSGDKWFLRAVYCVLVLNIIFCGLFGLAEKVTHRDLLMIGEGDNKFVEGRIDGPFGNAEEFGMVMIIFIFFVVNVGSSMSDGRAWKGLRRASILIGAFGVVFTLTRGIWVSFVAGLLARMLIHLRKIIPTLPALLLVLVIAITLAPTFTGPRDSIFSQRIRKQDTIFARLATFQSALAVFQDRPLIGVGYGVFGETVERNPSRYIRYYRDAISVYTPHNSYLGTLAETGILGLFAFILMFGTVFSYAGVVRKSAASQIRIAWADAVICICTAYLAFGLVNDMTRNLAYINKLLFFLVGVVSGFADDTREMTASGSPDHSCGKILRQ
jgi:hypothetical protein